MTMQDRLKESLTTMDAGLRRLLITGLASIALFILCYALLSGHLANLERKLVSRESTLKELMPLQQRYKEVSGDAQRLTNRLSAVTAEDSPVSVIEQSGIVAKAGIQAKPLPRQEKNGSLEEQAEVSLAGLNLNEAVNLLHRLEYGAKPVTVRKAVIRSRFSDPSKLDLTLTVGLLRPPATPERK